MVAHTKKEACRRLALTGIFTAALGVASFASPNGTGAVPEGYMDSAKHYDAMLERSLMSAGNNARMKAAIAKAERGEDVHIAYIGGSITEGGNASEPEKSWAYLSFKAFRDRYAPASPDAIHYVNAGMSGTPSALGMIRYERDVLERIENGPDVLFVEFAVNDGDDPTRGAAYESLVLKALKTENPPAVVLMFSVFKSRWNLQDRLAPIGRLYGLPMISIKDALVPELEAGRIAENQFFADIYHPGDWGHELMAACVSRYFDKLDASAADSGIPLPDGIAVGDRFAGVKMIDSSSVPKGVIIDRGAFSATDENLGTFIYDRSRKTFPDNWHKAGGAGNQPFTMTLTCKNLLIVYKKASGGSPFGLAEVSIDGEFYDAYDGVPSGGWNNPWTSVLIDEEAPATHTITVRMAEDCADSAFTILAFGYTEN
ncbi:MAG: SGNH/GDSL hydrolase family protein [Spirochaetales bacterium]|nr:SGNH/GDSL hydrolase family protein [Spirochaetales bacterium]